MCLRNSEISCMNRGGVLRTRAIIPVRLDPDDRTACGGSGIIALGSVLSGNAEGPNGVLGADHAAIAKAHLLGIIARVGVRGGEDETDVELGDVVVHGEGQHHEGQAHQQIN